MIRKYTGDKHVTNIIKNSFNQIKKGNDGKRERERQRETSKQLSPPKKEASGKQQKLRAQKMPAWSIFLSLVLNVVICSLLTLCVLFLRRYTNRNLNRP